MLRWAFVTIQCPSSAVRCLSCFINIYLVDTLEATVFAQSTWNLVRMFVLISRTSFNFGHLGSKTRSLDQIKEIPCGYSRGHNSCTVNLNICQNFCLWIGVNWGKKLDHYVKLKKYLVGTVQATFLAQLTWKLVRMFILIKSWMTASLGHLGT